MNEERQGAPQNSTPDHEWTSETWKPVLVFGAVVLVIALMVSQPSFLARDEDQTRRSADSVKDLAIMGGVKRTNLSKDFRGGEATAVMGGIELDLRDAVMDRREAVLDVSSVMGGVKIRVPDSWTVVPRVNSIMGGFQDTTRHPATDDHRLVLKGTVLMGGLEVRN